MNTHNWRERVLIETARRGGDPFGAATAAIWSTLAQNWHDPQPVPTELVARLTAAAPAAVELNRRRCAEAMDAIRLDLGTLEVLPTLANVVLADLNCREKSRLEGGDDMLEPEVELLAGLMLSTSRDAAERNPPTTRGINDLLVAALRVHAYADLWESAGHIRDGDTVDAAIRSHVRTQYLGVRGTAYLPHSDDLARALLGGRDGQWFVGRFGFAIEDVIAVRDAIRSRWSDGLARLLQVGREGVASGFSGDPRRAFDACVARLADVMAIRLDHLERDVPGVDPARAGALLAELSCDARSPLPFDDVYAESPVLSRPWVTDGTRALLVLPGRMDTELIDLFERRLIRTMPGFSKRRAGTVDDESVRLLASVLPGSDHYVRLGFQMVEDGKSKNPEIDGLVVYDDVAIVVEAKGMQLSLPARRGDVRRMRRDLRDITVAWDQAQRDIRFLRSREEVDFVDGTGRRVRVRGGRIRRIYVVLPTLHPLTNWSLDHRDLVACGVLPADAYPWLVSVTDMRIVTESISRPAELIAYLEWRAAVLAADRLIVPDETELFGTFLWGADVSAMQHPEGTKALVMDMQVDFDDYHRKLASGERDARPPAKRMPPLVGTYLDHMERERQAGWLERSVACLTAPYHQLVAIEAAAKGFVGRVSRGRLGIAMVGDTAVVCFREGEHPSDVLDAARRLPSAFVADRTFFFALGPHSVRLAASTGRQPWTDVFAPGQR
jgi:hypothetical protein